MELRTVTTDISVAVSDYKNYNALTVRVRNDSRALRT